MTSPLGRVYTTKVEPLPHEAGWPDDHRDGGSDPPDPDDDEAWQAENLLHWIADPYHLDEAA